MKPLSRVSPAARHADGHAPVSASASAAPAAHPPVWDSRTLLGTGSLAHITHQGQIYRLQLTRQGKLILGK